jgi:hypothetical protein
LALLLCTHIPASRCRGAASTSSAPTGTPSRPCRVRGRAPRCAHAPIAAADRRRAGLVDVCSNDTSFEIVGQASTRGEALERAPPGTPGASSVAATVIGRCASTGGASRLGPGGRAHSPGADKLLQGQETGALNGRALAMSTRLATTMSSQLRLPTSTTTRPALDGFPTIFRLAATGPCAVDPQRRRC